MQTMDGHFNIILSKIIISQNILVSCIYSNKIPWVKLTSKCDVKICGIWHGLRLTFLGTLYALQAWFTWS